MRDRQQETGNRPGGPLIAPAVADLFDEVVGKAVDPSRVCAEVTPARLRPPLACVPDLLDQVVAVLGGNPVAAERFRMTLRGFGGDRIPTSTALRALQPSTDEKRRQGGRAHRRPEPLETGGPALVDAERLEPVLAAAVYASRDAAELATAVGGIELGLAGLAEMQNLFDLALAGADPAAVAGAFDTAVRVMSWRGGFTPGDVPWPVPGGGRDPGAPWWEWPPTPGGPLPGWPTPVPVPEVPRGPGLIDVFEDCLLHEVIPELHRRGIGFRAFVAGGPGGYVIDEVTPADGCPGDLITITGSRFSGVTEVRFVDVRGGRIGVAPTRASESGITVRLPEEARSGPVWLYIPVTTRLCRTSYTMAKPGTPGTIRVGRPSIREFGVLHGVGCVALGESVTLRWSVRPADAEVAITEIHAGAEVVLEARAAAVGELVTTPTAAGAYRYRIDVTNPSAADCGDASATVELDVKPRDIRLIRIVGVELTQGIQVFHLADPPPEPNNSIPLTADMDTVLRVYVRTSHSAVLGGLANYTGRLTYRGTTYAPINASPFLDAPATPDRTITDHSLNFLIPAADARGAAETATVEVFTRGSCVDSTDTWEEPITFRERPVLGVTIRRIADSGPSPNVISAADAVDLIRRAFFRIPSPKTDIRIHPGVHQIRAGTTEDNYCTDGGFYQLALSVAYEHNDNEGYPPAHHSTSWVGIFFQPGCDVAGMMAWPSTSTCITERNVETAAHEIMHTVGLGHTVTRRPDGSDRERCEDIAQPVACHRLTDLSGADTNGVLQHVPFDIELNRAVSPANDLQSYSFSAARWLSAPLWLLGRNLIDTRY